jgi:hypothetical protein
MFHRIGRVPLAAALLCLLAGCIEVRQVITLNPDGRGKYTVDTVTPADTAPVTFGPGKQDDSLDGKKRRAVSKFLADARGVTAWKDVSAEWTRDGRLHVRGTAYFERLEDLGKGGTGGTTFSMKREGDGVLKIRMKLEAAKGPTNKKGPPPDVAKLTDKQLDEEIFKQRVLYQSGRPIMTAMLTDMKLEVMLRVPGDVRDVKGWKKDGKRSASWAVDGNAVLAQVKAVMAEDDAALRKRARKARTVDLVGSGGPAALFKEAQEAEVTVDNLTGPQFDYAKEVSAARAAYPALRERFKLDANTKLPGESGPAPGK